MCSLRVPTSGRVPLALDILANPAREHSEAKQTHPDPCPVKKSPSFRSREFNGSAQTSVTS